MSKLILLAVLLTAVAAKPHPQFHIRCKPLSIQRDVLCGCYVGKVYGFMTPAAVRRCMITFRVGTRRMRQSCSLYMKNGEVNTEKLIDNLTFIYENCPVAKHLHVRSRMLTPEQIVEILAEIQDMILEILRALNKPGASIDPGSRIIIDAGNDAKHIKAARLVAYNNLHR